MKIAIISGKGGTGKSTITSALTAIAQDVIAVDCDVDAANLYLIFHPTEETTIPFSTSSHAVVNAEDCIGCSTCSDACHFGAIECIDGLAVVDERACEGCQLCTRICPTQAIHMEASKDSYIYIGNFRYGKMVRARLTPGEENSGMLVTQLRKKAEETAKEKGDSLLLLDGPPGIGCPVIASITGVDKVVVVCEPSLSGIADMKRACQLASSQEIPIYLIINKCDLDQENSDSVRAWAAEKQYPVIAMLPFESDMVAAQMQAKTIVEYAPQSICSNELRKAFEQLTLS